MLLCWLLFKMNALPQLPYEIWEHILGYLDTFELIQFSIAFPSFTYLLQSGSLTKTINISRMFETFTMDMCRVITTKFNYKAIKTLKIDGLYWIPASDLVELVRNLENLRELCAVDTNLNLNQIKVYTKLTKLSLTVDIHRDFNHSVAEFAKNLVRLRCLFLKIICLDHCSESSEEPESFFSGLNLDELWISDEKAESLCNYDMNFGSIFKSLSNLRKLVFSSKDVLTYWNLCNCDFELDFENVFNSITGQCIYEKDIIRSRKLNFGPDEALQHAWDLVTYQLHAPCGTEYIQMCLSDNIEDINFVDLNFVLSYCPHELELYIEAAHEVLLSKTCKFLKRLSFRSCFFCKYDKWCMPQNENEMQTDQHPFCQITENLNNLKELEIHYCDCDTDEISGYIPGGYMTLFKFSNLERLSLDVPNFLDGSFLENILSQCEKLHTLSLKCLSQNEKFINNLYDGLKYAKVLKDFSLRYVEIGIDSLFKSFNIMKEKKLQRLYLNCDIIKCDSKERSEVYREFFQGHTQLVLFFIVAYKHTWRQNIDIQRILDNHRDGNQAKFFLIHNNLSDISKNKMRIPTAHHDIVLNNYANDDGSFESVSVIHFEEF